jgi:hypothetical protein
MEQHKFLLHQIIDSNSNHSTCQRFKLCGKKICENVVLEHTYWVKSLTREENMRNFFLICSSLAYKREILHADG